MNATSKVTSTARRARAAGVVMVALLAGALLVGPVPASATAPKIVLTPSQSAAKNALNRDRKVHGLRLLVSRADAQAKAQAWAERLAKDGYLHHSRLTDGIGGHACRISENVGNSNNPTGTIPWIEGAFMLSPIHRKNLLDPTVNSVGVGVATGGGYTYVVQVFVRTC